MVVEAAAVAVGEAAELDLVFSSYVLFCPQYETFIITYPIVVGRC